VGRFLTLLCYRKFSEAAHRSVNRRHVLFPFPCTGRLPSVAYIPDRRTNDLHRIIRHIQATSGERNVPFCRTVTGTRIGRLVSLIDDSSLRQTRHITSNYLRINRPSSVAMFPQAVGLVLFTAADDCRPLVIIAFDTFERGYDPRPDVTLSLIVPIVSL